MNKKTPVCILMSTYNGQKYLREQLDSLLVQEGVDVRIVIRDEYVGLSITTLLTQYNYVIAVDVILRKLIKTGVSC